MNSSANALPLQGCRVLVVEDEYFVADDIARALTRVGAALVGPVGSREAALAMLASRAPVDFAVLDINLQGESVFPVADALTARGVPFVFATGYDQASVPDRFSGIARWEKPFDPHALASQLGAEMERVHS